MKRTSGFLGLSVLLVGLGQGATACSGDSKDEGTGGAKAGGAGTGSGRGGRNQAGSSNGGRGARGGSSNGMGGSSMGGTVSVDQCQDLSSPPEDGQACSLPNGTYCEGSSGPCLCEGSGRDQRWKCYSDGQAQGGSGGGTSGSAGTGQAGSGNQGQGGGSSGSSGEPGQGDAGSPPTAGTGGTSSTGNAGESGQAGAAGS